MAKVRLAILLLLLSVQVTHAQVTEPTEVVQRYYCIAGDAPAGQNFFLAGHVDISGVPFQLWCQALY